MTKHNQRIGRWGEDAVAAYLAIFVEVKTLTSSRNFFPEQNVTARKQAHMLACAEHYAMENTIDHWQIDVIAVEGKAGMEPKITHFENAL
jgi:Holliday junction resolvase-like predicted endonuclease